jgi:predicted enzyme related to lactoylglutathione lyase
MYLENLVIDALEPQRLGEFWEVALGGERLTDEPDNVETRLRVGDAFALDLCFQRALEPPSASPRLHLDLLAGDDQAATVDRMVSLGARHLDIGQGDVPWVVLADPEGNAFCVLEERSVYVDTGPIAALPLASADPARDGEFWSWLTGWTVAHDPTFHTLRHPSGHGPHLELIPEAARKGQGQEKNRLHLDVRLEPGEDPDDVASGILERGGQELHPGWGELPWRIYEDPSGNEFCVLPARG